MSHFTIKQIFQDNWSNFLSDNPDIFIRPVVSQEVNKIIHCGNPKFGHAIYICECFHKIITVPFRCKSRFCNTCGTKYAQDRTLLNGLFEAASQTVLSWFHDLNKSQNFIPGIMCTLHTFGRDLKWNPHIHMLCTEGRRW